MNLLGRLCVVSGGLSLLGCRRSSSSSIGLRCLSSFVPADCAKKEDPRWAMINYGVARSRRNDNDSVAKSTMAESCTSTGRHLRVSLGLAPPPASSFFYYDWPGSSADEEEDEDSSSTRGCSGSSATGADDDEEEDSATTHGYVVAAHGDSALLNVTDDDLDDYFVYTAGTANKPPSLVLLPDTHGHDLSNRNTGILRRGEDELLVAKLSLASYETEAAHMWTHRHGSRKWEVKKVPILLGGKKVPTDDGLFSYTTVPVGDRFMCWFDYRSGLLVCDMAEAAEGKKSRGRLKLRYVQLPESDDDDTGWGPNDRHSWDIGAAGDRAVRFVSVDPRCCCGHSPTKTDCPNSPRLFAVHTWTLALTTAEEKKKMAWVKGNTLDCEELWALPGYKGLPRTLFEFPVVSAADPDVVCFMVREGRKKWIIQVDTWNKAILSTVRWNADVTHDAWLVHVSAKLPWLITSDTPASATKS